MYTLHVCLLQFNLRNYNGSFYAISNSRQYRKVSHVVCNHYVLHQRHGSVRLEHHSSYITDWAENIKRHQTYRTRINDTIYNKSSIEENFCSFHDFSLNHGSFPANLGLVDQQYKYTSMVQQMFYHEWPFSTQNVNFLPHRCFL